MKKVAYIKPSIEAIVMERLMEDGLNPATYNDLGGDIVKNSDDDDEGEIVTPSKRFNLWDSDWDDSDW